MPQRFPCPYLGGEVELTDERAEHIAARHAPEANTIAANIAAACGSPDAVFRRKRQTDELLLARRIGADGDQHFVAAIVVVDALEQARYWIVTAYVTRRLPGGIGGWQREL